MSVLWMILITLAVVQLSALATTVYLHRSVTHRSVELHPAVRFLMHLELMMFTGIEPRRWAAVHRKHHQFPDREGDPHSPRLLGLWNVLAGNYFYYRKEARNEATVRKYTPDYKPGPLDRIPLASWGGILGLAVFVLAFGWIWGAAAWAIHAVLYVTVNAMVNGLGHAVGYKNHDNTATNLRWLAWISAGEGLHNNHHAHPASARFSETSGEIDVAWPFIRMLEKVGLARVERRSAARAA
jgi:stearoyl-CoA desaturase (delta-9 desaturase)